MDPRLVAYHDARIADLNLDVARGLANTHLKSAAAYVNSILESAFRNHPQGLEYIGMSRATPHEEFQEYSRKRKAKNSQKTQFRSYDLSKSTKAVYKIHFRHKGTDLENVFLAVPYADNARGLYVRGTRYNVSPVINDVVFSVGTDSVFCRLMRARVSFKNTSHRFIADGDIALSTIIYSSLHNEKQPPVKERLVTCHTSLLLYTFAKMGYSKAMEHYLGFVPDIGEGEAFLDAHPNTEWVICRSLERQPKTSRLDKYEPVKTFLAVRREDFSLKVKDIVGGYFYIADNFSNKLETDHLEDTLMWRTLLGYSLFARTDHYGRIIQRTNNHMSSLDNYIDTIVTNKLMDMGYECTDIYTFFGIIQDEYAKWRMGVSDSIITAYGKELSVLYWVMLDITSSIFKLYFNLTNGDKEMSTTDVKKAISQHLGITQFYMLSSGKHAELSNEVTTSTIAPFKLTSAVVPQAETARDRSEKSHKTVSTTDESKAMHISIMEVHSHVEIQKAEGTGRTKLNPFVRTDPKGRILRWEKHRAEMDHAQQLIAGQ